MTSPPNRHSPPREMARTPAHRPNPPGGRPGTPSAPSSPAQARQHRRPGHQNHPGPSGPTQPAGQGQTDRDTPADYSPTDTRHPKRTRPADAQQEAPLPAANCTTRCRQPKQPHPPTHCPQLKQPHAHDRLQPKQVAHTSPATATAAARTPSPQPKQKHAPSPPTARRKHAPQGSPDPSPPPIPSALMSVRYGSRHLSRLDAARTDMETIAPRGHPDPTDKTASDTDPLTSPNQTPRTAQHKPGVPRKPEPPDAHATTGVRHFPPPESPETTPFVWYPTLPP